MPRASPAPNGAEPHPLVIVVVEDIQRPGVIRDHAQQRLGLVGGDIVPIKHLADDAQRLFQFLQAPLVHRVALQQVVAQDPRSPDAELRAAFRVHPIADGEDRVEVEVLDLVRLSVGGSCCKKCNNCLVVDLPFPKDIPQVPGNHRLIALEQGGYLVEIQPEALALEPDIQLDCAILPLI